MRRDLGDGEKAGLTKAAGGAAGDLHRALERLERIDWHIPQLIGEGVISKSDLSTLRKVHRRLNDRGVSTKRRR